MTAIIIKLLLRVMCWCWSSTPVALPIYGTQYRVRGIIHIRTGVPRTSSMTADAVLFVAANKIHKTATRMSIGRDKATCVQALTALLPSKA